VKIANEWEYCGHIGRDARFRMLPILGRRAKEESAAMTIRFTILNPANIKLCAAYADFRSRSRTSTLRPHVWDTETVQADLLATIICLIRAKAQFPDLIISLGLSGHFSLWRFDRSDQILIATQEDPQRPAYCYARGSRFYAYHLQECKESWLQSAQFTIPKQAKSELSDLELLNQVRKNPWPSV